jgi:hypothetical protein
MRADSSRTASRRGSPSSSGSTVGTSSGTPKRSSASPRKEVFAVV